MTEEEVDTNTRGNTENDRNKDNNGERNGGFFLGGGFADGVDGARAARIGGWIVRIEFFVKDGRTRDSTKRALLYFGGIDEIRRNWGGFRTRNLSEMLDNTGLHWGFGNRDGRFGWGGGFLRGDFVEKT